MNYLAIRANTKFERLARVLLVSLAWVACAAAPATAPSTSAAVGPETRTGKFTAEYAPLAEKESSKLVTLVCDRDNHIKLPVYTRAAMWKRAGEEETRWNLQQPANLKPPTDDTQDPPNYQIYVPADYTPDKKFGLLVWNSAGPRGDIPRQFVPVCDRHHLIWVAPGNVGNYRNSAWRIYMAMEAVTQAKHRFNIDPKRVFVSGGSGGGRVSSIVALEFADTFNGGVYIIGCDYYKNVPATNHPGQAWRGYWAYPDLAVLNRAKRNNYFVILEGSKDINLDEAKDVFEVYKKDGFKHITFLEVPAMGHTMPPEEWFEKAIAAIDPPAAGPALK